MWLNRPDALGLLPGLMDQSSMAVSERISAPKMPACGGLQWLESACFTAGF
jgi:hypothetical protein